MDKKKTISLAVVIHHAEEGGYWAEVPSLPGCATQGETKEELLANVREAIELFLEEEAEDELPAEAEEATMITVTVAVKDGRIKTVAVAA